MRSWVRIILQGVHDCAHDYLAIRSSLSIRHVKWVAQQWHFPIVCPVSRISPAYHCIESLSTTNIMFGLEVQNEILASTVIPNSTYSSTVYGF